MKRLYKRLLIFLLPVILTWAGLEFFYRTAETNYTYKHQRVQQEYDSTVVLVLGSSHSYFGINPEFFDQPTYNLANISQSLYFDELLLQKHIDSLQELQAIILPIGYFTLSQKDNGLEDRWRKYFYQQQMELDVPIVSDLDIRKYSLTLSRRFDKSVELFQMYLKKGSILTCYENGYGIQDSSDIVADKAKVSRNIARKHEDGLMDFSHNISRLQRMIDICNERQVRVLLVEMPVFPEYYASVNATKRDSISATLAEIALSNKNAFHLDLKTDPRFSKYDLRDADHLTNEGAAKCSRILSDFLKGVD